MRAREHVRASESEGGFTLLEVLISLAILSGVIVTVLTVMNSHIAASTRLSDTSTAVLAARERLEGALLEGVPKTGGEIAGMPGYSVEYSLEDTDLGLEKICAEVGWGKDEKVEVCAYSEKKD